MQKISAIIGSFLICSSFSDTDKMACAYAESNIGYVKSQIEKAITAKDINTSRYYAYKALNAIEKSKKQLEACSCEYALKSIYEGLANLKLATRVSSLNGTRILLNRALENSWGSLEALEEHDEMHHSKYASDLLAMNTRESDLEKEGMKQPRGKLLEETIDKSLLRYQASLDKVVRTVECREAHAFALRIYNHCEQELLKANLTEAKKYYNLRTKEITRKALEKLGECDR